MGKKIALLLGVSKYENEVDLIACENDLTLMAGLLEHSESFDDIEVIGNSPSSSFAKEKITSFVKKYQGEEVDQVFFYYTGHGTRHQNDFLFLFSDFNWDKKEQTSFRNTELDSMLKSLSPKLAVKVVDACKAGTEYIKSESDLESILKKSSDNSYEKIYFLFSSSSSENSIAYDDYSVFTKSFALSLCGFSEKEIRFRDIMSFISDDLNVKKHQTPLFIQQAINTESFCVVSPELVKFVKSSLSVEQLNGRDEKDQEVVETSCEDIRADINLVSAVKRISSNYCSEAEAKISLEKFVEDVENFSWGKVLPELYEISFNKQQGYHSITGLKGVGKWFQDSEEPYFARLDYTEVAYEAKERIEVVQDDNGLPSAFGLLSMMGNSKRFEYRPVTKYRKTINGIVVTASNPCDSISFDFSPREEALPWFRVFIVFIFSKSKLTVFNKFEFDKESSWSSRRTKNEREWSVYHCPLKNHEKISSLVSQMLNKSSSSILKELEKQFSEN